MSQIFRTLAGGPLLPAVLTICLLLLAPRDCRALTAQVTPAAVPITFTYHGAELKISGDSAVDDDIIVKVSSPAADVEMKFKDKVAGLFWMKKGSLEFKGVPGVYLLATSAALDSLLPPQILRRNMLGLDAVVAGARVENDGGGEADGKWLEEFVRFKRHEMVYAVQEGTVVRRHGPTSNAYEVTVAWPFQAPPGTYDIEVLAVRDGRITERTATSFVVERKGVVAALSKMAIDQAALYGIMAIVIAMAAGFAVGAIFKKGGGSH
ncbi:MAG: TIGR02186 family protein [Thermodesulfobacteriota bacterium]